MKASGNRKPVSIDRLTRHSVGIVLLVASTLRAASTPGESGTQVEYRPAACQIARLRNGFTLKFAQREVAGATTRLWLCGDVATGYVEIPTDQVEGFEKAEEEISPDVPLSAPEKRPDGTLTQKSRIASLITEAASRYEIDPDFVTSVVKAESGFNPAAVSIKGARGLMQLMPRTAAGLGVENILDPAANLEGGTKYLRKLLDQYDGDAVKALAAYNAGPKPVEKYRGVPPYHETQAYVARIIDDYNRKKIQQQSASGPPPQK